MLKLRFYPGQTVFLNDDIKIKVLSVDPSTKSIELGFQAPNEVRILRGRLYYKLKNEEEQDKNKN